MDKLEIKQITGVTLIKKGEEKKEMLVNLPLVSEIIVRSDVDVEVRK